MDYFQAKLFQRINYERQTVSGVQHFKLANLIQLLQRLGDPHRKYPVIHVAGTKGKGSTSTMLASILAAAGLKTGLYTSPHLESVHQRISIDGSIISNTQLEDVLSKMDSHIEEVDRCTRTDTSSSKINSTTSTAVLPSAEAGPGKLLTFFEVITAAAMFHFANEECDVVVLEVGMGGRLDSTNVCHPDVCVITNISLDHTRQLGSTVEKIAFEKAGIIKPGIPVICGAHQAEVIEVIAGVAYKNQAPLRLLGREFQIDLESDGNFRWFPLSTESDEDGNWSRVKGVDQLRVPLLGRHQRANAALAIAAARQFEQSQSKLLLTDEVLRAGLASAKIPGRTELAGESPTIVLDIAHNEASIHAMIDSLREDLPGWSSFAQKTLVFASSKDKDVHAMLKILLPCFDRIVITEFTLNPRCMDSQAVVEIAEELLERMEATTELTRHVAPDDAWHWVKQSSNDHDLICVAGSAFLIAELRPLVVGSN